MKRSPLTRNAPMKRGDFSPLKRSRINPVSKNRAKESRVYAAKRKAFLEAHPFCQLYIARHGLIEREAIDLFGSGVFRVYVAEDTWTFARHVVPRSCDIHHKAGRSGKNYLDESTWMAVSREGHDWIHAHPKEARAKGWLT